MADSITNPQNKWELRDYLTSIDCNETNQTPPENVWQKAEEAIGHVRRVMKPYRRGERGKPLQDYYGPYCDKIETAYTGKRPEEFTHALKMLWISMDSE